MKKIYTSLGVTAMLFLTTSVSAQQRISETQIQPVLEKLKTLGSQNPYGMFPVAKLSKEEYKLYAAYQKQQNEDRNNPYGITEQDLKNKINLSQVQPILDKINALGNTQLAFPEDQFTKSEMKLLRIYELQNVVKTTSEGNRALTMSHVLNTRVATGATRPYGTMPLVPPYALNVLSSLPNAVTIYADDVAGDGILYGVDTTARTLVKMNEGGVLETVVAITGVPTAETYAGLSWNPANSTMYLLASTNLYTLNMTSGVATLVGSLAPMTIPIWLEIDNNGNAYSLDISDDNIYSVNLSTGAPTLVGSTGANFNFAQDADFNRDTNQLYMAGYRGGGAAGIYTVDTSTGLATLVGDTTPLNAEFSMYSITNSLTPPLDKAYATVIYDPAAGTAGVYSLPLATPNTMTLVGANSSSLFADDLAGDGNVYALNYDTNTLVKIYNDGTSRTVGALTNLVAGSTVSGLSWNSANNMMYATSIGSGGGYLYSVDLSTGALTFIGNTTGSNSPIWLEIDNSGNAYVADITTDSLYSLNLTTGAASLIGALGMDIGYAQDADFNTDTNELYMAAMYNAGANSGLYKVNLTTGAATSVGATDGKELGTFTITDTLPDPPPIPPVTCGSVFTDTGGTTGNYANSEDVSTVIQPVNAGDGVTITFTYVDIESATGAGTTGGCWDYLTVYNGPDSSSPELAAVKCGEPSGDGGVPSVSANALNIGDSFTSTDASGKLTVRFRSDSSVTETGWEASVTCASLAVDETAGSKFSFYPNPTSGILNIHAAKNIELVEVFNLVGQKVMTLNPKEKKSEINMSSLKPGVYLVKATVDGKVTTNKVIKK